MGHYANGKTEARRSHTLLWMRPLTLHLGFVTPHTHTSCCTSLAFFPLLPAVIWGLPCPFQSVGALVDGEPASFCFREECVQERREQKQFSRPWKLPAAIGKPEHQIPVSQSLAPSDLAGSHLDGRLCQAAPRTHCLTNHSPASA